MQPALTEAWKQFFGSNFKWETGDKRFTPPASASSSKMALLNLAVFMAAIIFNNIYLSTKQYVTICLSLKIKTKLTSKQAVNNPSKKSILKSYKKIYQTIYQNNVSQVPIKDISEKAIKQI